MSLSSVASIKSPVGPVETIRFNMIITLLINTNDVVSCLLFFFFL